MNDSENKVFENGDKKVKIIVSVIVALIIAVSSFFIGFFTHKLTRDEYVSSVEWVMSMIEKNYYFSEDFDKEDAKNLSLKALVSKLDIFRILHGGRVSSRNVRQRRGKERHRHNLSISQR